MNKIWIDATLLKKLQNFSISVDQFLAKDVLFTLFCMLGRNQEIAHPHPVGKQIKLPCLLQKCCLDEPKNNM